MKIHNHATGEYIETYCDGGCYCHGMPITFGLTDGCCNNCGCPKNTEGWNHWLTAHKAIPQKEDAHGNVQRLPGD